MTNPKILQNVRLIQKCLIVRSDGKILALKRSADDHSRGGNWDLPGGGYEAGEQVIEAIKREIKEEAGLAAHTLNPIFIDNHMNVEKGFFAGLNVFGVCYVCKDWEGEVILSDEHTEYQWVTPDEFAQLSFGDDNGFFAASIQHYNTLSSSIWHIQKTEYDGDMNASTIINNASLLKALGHNKRLEIICLLHGHELTVNQIVQMTGMRQAAVSQHLMHLKSHKLVQAKKLGKELYYTLFENTLVNLSLFFDHFAKPMPLINDEPELIDPVCHMSLTPTTARFTKDYAGVRHYFCGRGCLNTFTKEHKQSWKILIR